VHTVFLGSSNAGVAVVVGVVVLAIAVLEIWGMWRIFTKGGRPGWAALVPIFNVYTLCKVVGRPGWWTVLFFIPIVWWIVPLVVYWDLCKSFAKGWGFWAGLVFLPFVFIPVLGLGDARYEGPSAPAA
jgi:hypothetical protein